MSQTGNSGMDPEAMRGYLSEVPLEIRNVVKPLNNDKVWAILIVLLKREEMRFSDIKSTFHAQSSGEIDRYLKALTAAGLVERRARVFADFGGAEKAYYCPTPLARSLIRGLFQSILLQPHQYRYQRAVAGTADLGYHGIRREPIRIDLPQKEKA